MSYRNTECGNALIYVFVGVALFGTLMFVFSRGASQNSSKMSSQQANVKASEIMERSNTIARVVDKLLVNGCSINELNFYSDHFTQSGTANPNAPADGHCDVYSPKGGKIVWEAKPDPTLVADPYWSAPQVPSGIVMPGIGSQPEDLTYIVMVRKEVCLAINASLGLPTTNLPFAGLDSGPYIGTFTKSNSLPHPPSGGNYAPFTGKTEGCVYWKNRMQYGGEYFVYYKALVVL